MAQFRNYISNINKSKEENTKTGLEINFSSFSIRLIINNEILKKKNEEISSNEKENDEDEKRKIRKYGNSSMLDEFILSYYESLNIKYMNMYITNKHINNIDILRYKAENDYYISGEEFINDLSYLISLLKENYSNSHLSKKLDSYYLNTVKIYNEVFRKKNFSQILTNDHKLIISSNKLPKRDENSNFKNIPVAKEYEIINDYYHILPNITSSRMNSDIINNNSVDLIKQSLLGPCNFCFDISSLGPINLENGGWDSKCECRKRNFECSDQCICGCLSKSECKNQTYRNSNSLILGKDVIAKYSWGIDLFTYRNLINFLPCNISEYVKSKYIEKVLIPELSNINENGWNIKLAIENLVSKFRYIIYDSNDNNDNNYIEENKEYENNKDEVSYIKNSYYFSNHLLSIYNNSSLSHKSFTAFCKGIGIFCNKPEGIKSNELIAPYLGEIYPQWYWFEKQDLIKSKNLDKELPDFYNIQLERLKSEPTGYHLLMVDPNNKGNFVSRMSHCCQPNCQTVTMISENKYLIGMYSVTDIQYGEELTFDYNSITEKEKEYKEAICLCGSYYCRGHYLIFSNGKNYNEIINSDHSFLHRNALFIKSCMRNNDDEKNENQVLIKKNLFKFLTNNQMSNEFIEKSPIWLMSWASEIIKFYNFENELMPYVRYILDKGYRTEYNKLSTQEISIILNELYEIEANSNDSTTKINQNLYEKTQSEVFSIEKENISGCDVSNIKLIYNDFLKEIKNENLLLSNGIKDSRMQNMYITIDKILHVLSISDINSNQPPIIKATDEEIIDFMWNNKEYSLRILLYNNIINLIDKGTDDFNNKIFEVINKIHEDCLTLTDVKMNLIKISKILYDISKISSSSKFAAFEPLSDIVLLQAKTKNYFKFNSLYPIPDNSVNISILQRDISTTSKVNQSGKSGQGECNMTQDDLNKIVAEGCKKYDKYYIWGQIVGWFKQTVNKPDASLLNDKKGCMIYPDVDSFFLSNICKNIQHYHNKDKEKEESDEGNLISNIFEPNQKGKSSNNQIEIYSTRKNKSNKYIKTGLSENDVIFKYPFGNDRNGFYSQLIENPYVSWTSHNRWIYKNKSKIFGTVQLDSLLDELYDDDYYKSIINYEINETSKNSNINKKSYLKEVVDELLMGN